MKFIHNIFIPRDIEVVMCIILILWKRADSLNIIYYTRPSENMIGNDSQLSSNINISRTMGRKGGEVHRIYPYLIFCSQSNYYRISAKQNGRSIFHTLCFVLSRITNELRRRKNPHICFWVLETATGRNNQENMI